MGGTQEKKETGVKINLGVKTRRQSDLGNQVDLGLSTNPSHTQLPNLDLLNPCTRENSPTQQPYLPKYTQEPT